MMALLKPIEKEIEKLREFESKISTERKKILNSFANYISAKLAKDETVNLIFICTHNSRRSIMAQVWAQTASKYFGIKNIQFYSGGTEVTAFNPNAVKAITDLGFEVKKSGEEKNPLYLVYYSKEEEALKCFSKIYTDKFNPQNNFAAIVTCSDADKNCPVVIGAEARFSVNYNDPKEFDGTALQEEKYSERFAEIGREMLYVFEKVNATVLSNR